MGVALAGVDDAYGGHFRRARASEWGKALLGSVPPPGLVLLGIVSVQVGAGLAKNLFGVLGPGGTVTLRLVMSALLLAFLSRRALRGIVRGSSASDIAVVVAFGATLAVMNFSIYQSFARIPLGIAVTIEFLGPLAVTIAASRRRLDFVWVLLAAAGVVVLGGSGKVNLAGVLFALVAAVAWAVYILLSAATGKRFAGSGGLTLASLVGAVMILPAGAATGGGELLRPEFLLLGLGVGLLSSVIPYTLELEALRRMPTRVFGIMMSLEPAVAAVVGLVILGEILSWHEWLAIGCVVLACYGAVRSQPTPPEAPEA